MDFVDYLVRLCMLAFVLAGIVVEIGEWVERRRALRRLLRDLPAAAPNDRAAFQTPTLVRLTTPDRSS